MIEGAAAAAALARPYASGLGLPIHDTVSPNAMQNGAELSTFSVDAFSFSNGGSTYAVTPGADGTLVGTKDGQAWRTWQLNPPTNAFSNCPSAAVALQILTAIKGHPEWASRSAAASVNMAI